MPFQVCLILLPNLEVSLLLLAVERCIDVVTLKQFLYEAEVHVTNPPLFKAVNAVCLESKF
jgi:hypothetical protein